MAEVKPSIEAFAKIKVIGVGGGGCSAVNRMVESKIKGVDFIVMNTDIQALQISKANKKLHIGKTVTRGLGAGMDPELGRKSAEENENEVRELLKGADMVFVTCGLGGGTGSGAAPFVAEIARELGALTVAVVTKPFTFEGAQRTEIAERAHELLGDRVDTVITVPNDRILQIIDKKTSMHDAFKMIDDVLRQGVQGISELITIPGLINVDFNDVKAIMRDAGSALMGIGHGSGENRAVEAAKAAIESPLLDVSIEGAKGILFVVTGGSNLGMYEVSEAAKIITSSTDPNAKVIFGSVIDSNMKDDVTITVIATGFELRDKSCERPIGMQTSYTAPFMRLEHKPAPEKNSPPTFFGALKSVAMRKEEKEESKSVFMPVNNHGLEENNMSKEEHNSNGLNNKTPEDDELYEEIPAFLRRGMERNKLQK